MNALGENSTAGSFGSTVKELRDRLGLRQQKLAKMTQLSQARISQIEAMPNADRLDNAVLLRLAHVLGAEVLEAARPSTSRSSQRALVALWRLRADILLGLSAGGLNENRRRQRMLGQTILRAAMRNPAAHQWGRDGELRSLPTILGTSQGDGSRALDDQVSWDDRVLILAEVAGMKIDAPLQTRDWDKEWDLIITSGLDILGPDVPLTAADFMTVRDRPNWQDLTCVGGGMGILEALSCGDPDTLVLRGHDPVGWLGWPYVAGRWLVQPSQHYSPDALNNAAQLGTNLAINPVGQVAWPQTRLGDVAVQRIDIWRGELGSALDAYPPPAAPWVAVPSDVRETLAVAQALGQRWVRVEANKIVTAYRIRRHRNDVSADPRKRSLPLIDEAIQHLEQTNAALNQLKDAEEGESGTSSFEDNSVLGEWKDIQDSVLAVERNLKALQEEV